MKKHCSDCLKTKKSLKSQRDFTNHLITKFSIVTFLLVSLIACTGKKEAEMPEVTSARPDTVSTKPASRLQIIPGQCIGNISLEQDSEKLQAILGKPDLSDAAMGKAWLTWFSKVSDSVTGNELNIYTEYKDNAMMEKVVRQIRVTSDEFQTSEGICTGKSIDDISKIFPSIKMVGKYDVETNYPVTVYDAVDDGIAFEAENNKCTGIIVHKKGRPVSENYLSFHPDMKPM